MDDDLAAVFEGSRPRLQAMAYRMLGSLTEAEDAVQETWIRLSGSDAARIDNLGGWLTTVLSRVCLGMLRRRRTRREEPMVADEPAPDGLSPEDEAILADTMGPALLVVLDALSPAERLAFVLHDLFALPFDDVAPIVGRSPAAARQLASRARRRVQGAGEASGGDRRRQHEIVDAFLAASRQGDYEALVALLDPDAVLRADRVAVELAAANRDRGAPLLASQVRGAQAVASALIGRATAVKPALVEGTPGAVWLAGGRPRAAFA
ncbi:MAG: sigma-70 family RNA polymerase sigma factor, partial [Acidimicrobiales bacterium]